MKQVVQTLQLALEKEKTKVKDLKEQVRGRVQSVSLHLNLKLKFKLHNFHVMLSQSKSDWLCHCVVYFSWLQRRLRRHTIDDTTGQPCWSCRRLKRTCRPKRT